MVDICPKNHENPKYNILHCTLTIQFFDYNNYNHCDSHDLNRTTRSSFFTAQPFESKNEQKTKYKLKLENQNPN